MCAAMRQELRVRGSYLHHKEIKAAQGVKIAAQNLESAVAGTQMLVAGPTDDIDALKAEVMEDMKDIFGSVDRSGMLGRMQNKPKPLVCVAAACTSCHICPPLVVRQCCLYVCNSASMLRAICVLHPALYIANMDICHLLSLPDGAQLASALSMS